MSAVPEAGVEARIRACVAELEAARRDIAETIASYPPPVAGCDAQFNHLLEQRRMVDAALKALAGPAAGS